MASQTLTTRAVIQAVDNLTGPLSRMGGSVKQIAMTSQRHLDGLKASYAGFASKVNSIPIIGGGMAGAMGLAHVTHQLVEYDRKARQVQALNLMSGREWSQHQARFNALTDQYGINPEKVLHAAEAYQQLTGSMKGFDQIAQVAAKTSRITGTEMAEQVKEVNALARAFGFDATKRADIEHIERAYLVAAKGMMGGAHAFGSAMKSFGPVANSMGLSFEQASALVQSLGGQFEGGEIGNALKTIGLRISAPKDPALRALAAQGISPLDYMNIDKAKLVDGAGPIGLAKALKAGGFDPKGKDLSKLFDGIDVTTREGKRVFEERYLKEMGRSFGDKTRKGTTKFHGKDRGDLMEIERQWLASLGGTIDPIKFLHLLKPHYGNKQLMQRLFGTEHAPKGLDLLIQGAEHYAERLRHIKEHAAGATWFHKRGTGTIKRAADLTGADAIDARYSIVGSWKSISYQYDRMMGNMQAFWNVMSNKGTGGVLTTAFREAGNMFRSLQYVDPKVVQGVTAGLIGLAALPVGVFAAGAIASSVKSLGLLGLGMVRGLAALQLYPLLAARAATGITKVGAATRLAGAAMTGNALMGLGTFVGMLGKVARFTAMGTVLGGGWYALEHWGEVTEAFKNFSGTNAGKGMFASFSALGETAKGLGADLVAVADNLFKILGWKSENPDGAGGAAGTLETLAGWATMLADALNLAATALRAIIADSEKLPSWAPKWAQDIYAGNRDLERQQREQGAVARQALTEGGFTGWVDYMLGQGKYDPWGGRFAPKKAWFDFTSPGPDALGVPRTFPPGAFDRFQLYDQTEPISTGLENLTPEAINGPIVEAETAGADLVGGRVDMASAAIVAAITALAGAVSRSSFGGPANASPPASGNATGAKR